MVFPQTALPITVEAQFDGTWTDITSDVYERDAIRITRGRTDEGGQVDPGRCLFTLDNRDGKYSPRNPSSPYFGMLGRNTPVRVSADAGDTYLSCAGGDTDTASTPDAAALDLTGDMEIHIELSHDTWVFDADVCLAAKWLAAGDQRSYMLALSSDLELAFMRTTLGTAGTQQTALTTVPLPIPPRGRVAIKMVFDLDGGAGQPVTSFYTATSIDGPFTLLESRTTGSTTATFSGTATLTAGGNNGGSLASWDGRIHALKVVNGIGGTVVADVDFTAQTVADTSFVGDDGLTWTVNNDASLSNRQVRFFGEIAAWPLRLSPENLDIYVPVEAAGISRRLHQGAPPLKSTLARRIPQDPSIVAYWPMEDEVGSTRAASPISGVSPMAVRGLTFGSVDTLPGSAALPTVQSESGARAPQFTANVPASADGEQRIELVYFMETAPATETTFLHVVCTGSVADWYIKMDTSGSRILIIDGENLTIASNTQTWGSTEPFNDWYRLRLTMQQNGSNVDYELAWLQEDVEIFSDSGSLAGTLGHVRAVAGPPAGFSTNADGFSFGHLAVFDSVTVADMFGDADQGYAGETASSRVVRLCDEESVSAQVFGTLDDATPMGAQGRNTLLNLLQECAETDGGILYEKRNALSLAYRDRISLYNQDVALSLNYVGTDGLVTPLEPVDDDQHIRNDVTVVREGGSSARSELTEGPLSTQEPPNGVGRYAESVTLNLQEDEQTDQHAEWLLHLGTWDKARFPSVTVLLQKMSGSVESHVAVDVGDRLQITNPPSWLPPDTIDLMVQGYTELLHQFRWEIEYNCTPYGPWIVGVLDDDDARADTDGSTLATAVDTDDTTLQVFTQVDSALWVTSAANPSDVDFTLAMGGETALVTAITSSVVDDFGRTSASSWGSADVGGAWTITGGNNVNYAVGTGYGSHTLATTNVARASILTAPGADLDMYANIAVSALATGSSLHGALVARRSSADNMYIARLEFTTAPALVLSIRKRVAATETQLVTYTPGITYVASTEYRVRFQLSGTSLKAKVWPITASEPSLWQLSTTDSDLTAAASMGFRSIANSSNTNVNPAVRYDSLVVVNPQTFTVLRSSNGISKSHAVGTDIRLANPTYIAL